MSLAHRTNIRYGAGMKKQITNLMVFASLLLTGLSVHAAPKATVDLCGYQIAEAQVADSAEPYFTDDVTAEMRKLPVLNIVYCADKPDPENGEVSLVAIGIDKDDHAVAAIRAPIFKTDFPSPTR